MKNSLFLLVLLLAFSACDKEKNNTPEGPFLEFKFKFDETQDRLNSFGLPSTIPSGHAAQTPSFNSMSAHFIELAPSLLTPLAGGEEVYKGEETNAGGENAINFDRALVEDEDIVFYRIPLKDVTPDTYNHIRVSVAYQNYDVRYNIKNIPAVGDLNDQNGTIASFVGFNTYITSLTPKTRTKVVNDDKKQGYWAFETDLSAPFESFNQLVDGEAPEGSTTVVNPFSDEIPDGSCVVGGSFNQPLVITGDETENITVTLSFSSNQSFEWVDTNNNGEWDMDASGASLEPVVDMGLRGLKGLVE